MSKRSPFWRPFEKQHSKRDQTLLISEWNHLYHICWSQSRQLNWKKSLLVICKVLKMFVTILTGDGNYSLLNRDNRRQPILMQLSQKQKSFSQFVSDFLKCRLNFGYFQEKDDFNTWCISKIIDSKKTWLKKSLKRPFLEDPSGRYM